MIRDYSVRFRLQVKEQNDGAVIGAVDLRAHEILLDVLHEAFRDDEVVQAPADVLGASLVHVAPERVGSGGVGMQTTERVDKALR